MKWSVRQIIFRSLIGLAVLALAVFVVWRVHLRNEVKRQLAAIRAAGLPTSGAELNNYYPAVPDGENAALVMTQAFALIQNYPYSQSNEVSRLGIPPFKQPLTEAQNKLLVGYVGMNSNALAKAREAVKFPKSRYPVNYAPNFDALLPHLPNLQKISRLAGFEALIALQANSHKEAADLISFQFALCQTLDGEPLVLSGFNRGKIIFNASRLVEYGLNQGAFDEASLLKLVGDFTRVDKNGISPAGFIGERAMTLPYFQTNWSAMWRIISLSGIELPPLAVLRGKVGWISGLFDREEIFYLQAMKSTIDEVQAPFPKCLSLYSKIYQTALAGHQSGYCFAPGILNGMRNVFPKEVEAVADVRVTMTALAVERFRLANQQLPKKIIELVPKFISAVPEDPCDGQPLRFRLLEKGYLIYSVGKDGQNNGGRARPADAKSSDKTPYDLTFTVER